VRKWGETGTIKGLPVCMNPRILWIPTITFHYERYSQILLLESASLFKMIALSQMGRPQPNYRAALEAGSMSNRNRSDAITGVALVAAKRQKTMAIAPNYMSHSIFVCFFPFFLFISLQLCIERGIINRCPAPLPCYPPVHTPTPKHARARQHTLLCQNFTDRCVPVSHTTDKHTQT